MVRALSLIHIYFDLNALIQGATRTSISLGETLVMPFFDSGSATKLQFRDHWTPDNTNAPYPRLTSEVTVNNHRQPSSWWVRDATYIRLKSIEIGYTLPRSALNFIGISSAPVSYTHLDVYKRQDVHIY